jgi:ElaB/YqjD/DUF883 family membrane-anchored ribosome-binding protein
MPISPEPESPLNQYRSSAEVIEIPGTAEEPTTMERVEEIANEAKQAARGAINAATQSAGEALETAERAAKESASRIYSEARATAQEGYVQASKKVEEWTAITRRSAKLIQQEYPLRGLAVLAGVAFLLGITLRIWRDRRS